MLACWLHCENTTKHKKKWNPKSSQISQLNSQSIVLFTLMSTMTASLSPSTYPSIHIHPGRYSGGSSKQKWPPPHLSFSSERKWYAADGIAANPIMQQNTETQSNYVLVLLLKVIKQQILSAIDTHQKNVQSFMFV